MVVYLGAYDNPFIKHAVVVFPVAALIEDNGTYTNTERRVQLSQKRIEPFENVLPGWRLFPLIAAKASQNWNYSSAEDVFKEITSLTPEYEGLTYAKLMDSMGIQWPCNDRNPSGCKRLDIEKAEESLNSPLFQGTIKPHPLLLNILSS